MTLRTRSAALVATLTATLFMVGCETPTPTDAPPTVPVAEIHRAITPNCAYPAAPDDPVLARELVITDLNVVEDPCRTRWTGTWSGGACPAGSMGTWTYKYLIDNLAHGDASLANDIVTQWLESWRDPLLKVNGQELNRFRIVRDSMGNIKPNKFTELIIMPWRRVSGCNLDPDKPCTYDLKQAPFRLLAIVNRIDLAGLAGYVFDPRSQQSGGEGRLVFGFVNLDDPLRGTIKENPLQATVIFEYRLPPRSSSSLVSQQRWAMSWHNLNTLTPPSNIPSNTYSMQLQAITDQFVRSGVDLSGFNSGSALSQVRTNEQDFDTGSGSDIIWELREQRLQAAQNEPCQPQQRDCLLLPTVTKQTPSNDFLDNVNGTKRLTNYFMANRQAIGLENFEVPAIFEKEAFLAGVSRFTQKSPGPILNVWQVENSYEQGYPARAEIEKLAFGTCNGCHYVETGTTGFHVPPRRADQDSGAQLSIFLMKGLTTVTDPRVYRTVVAGMTMDVRERLDFNELERRRCEIRRILRGDPRPQLTPTGATRVH